jgi:hypothetical protein
MPPSALARAREVLQRLERYELDVFTEEETAIQMERTATAGADSSSAEGQAVTKAMTRAARRRAAAQASLFDLANQKVVDELREADPDRMSAEEAKQLLSELRKRLI